MIIFIDDKPMRVISVKDARYGFKKVKVGAGGVPTAEHSIPARFMDDPKSGACMTGGCVYSWQAKTPKAVPVASVLPPLETMRIPIISTNHLSAEAKAFLETYSARAADMLWTAEYGDGFFVLFKESCEEDSSLPQSIRDVATWAASRGYLWVRFDRGAAKVDGLTTYDW